MAKQDETTIAMRVDRKFTERIDEYAQKANMTRSEVIRTLVAKGINEQPNYPLAKFLVLAPETKALYVIMTPKPEGGAKVWTWNITENLYSELQNLDNLKELVAVDADILYWEV
jgi:predicted DNA-binding protein